MDIEKLTAFFMWCSIINVALLMLMFIVTAYAGNWIYGIHSKWYPLPRETFNTAIYAFIGVYKLLVYVFNIIPFVALLIIG